MVNKNILKVRKELDKLDNKLLEIIKKRMKLVNVVIKNKRYKKEIVDKKRISIILKNITRKSKQKKIRKQALKQKHTETSLARLKQKT